MLAVCNTLLFAVAGVFSSSVIRAVGRQTLISSSHCGFLAVNINNTGPSVIEDFSRLSNETLAAIMYSRECYGASNQLQCDSFPQPQLASTSEMNVSCPFQSQICIEGPNAAFQVKSGWIDTDKDLGINSKASDRLQYRKVTTCSVLHTTGYIHQSNITNSSHASFEVSYYNYGSLDPFNFTFSHSRQESEIANGYILAGLINESGKSSLGWTPIPELNRTDADVTIMFLSQANVDYESPVRDPWFMATTRSSRRPVENVGNLSMYVEDTPIRVLGCADQFQLCIQAHTKCTPLTGVLGLAHAVTAMQLTGVQKDVSLLLVVQIINQPTYFNVMFRGGNALRASDTLAEGYLQFGLPNNQWTIEIANWFDISMARLQQGVVTFATGPTIPDKNLKFVPGFPKACERQKINNTTGYISFSLLGVCIILTIGGLLIIISFVLDSIVGYFRKTFGWKDYKRLKWANDEQLELQRLAYPKEDILVSSEGNTVSQPSEGNAISQTSEGNPVSQTSEDSLSQTNEGNLIPQTREGSAIFQASEENFILQTSEENVVSRTNEENAISQTSEGNAVSQIGTLDNSETTTPEQAQA